MKYGNTKLWKNPLFSYLGSNFGNDKYMFAGHDSLAQIMNAFGQRDAELFCFWRKYCKAPRGFQKKLTAEKHLCDAIKHRAHTDESMMSIEKILFMSASGAMTMKIVGLAGQPLVDDWSCSKMRTYEKRYGFLLRYGRRYARAIANVCSVGVKVE